MRVELQERCRIVSHTSHAAFTSLCRWRGMYYLAYREAETHAIVPPGTAHILRTHRPMRTQTWEPSAAWAHPSRDYRDPRLIPTEEYLFCLLGAYVPSPHLEFIHGLSASSRDNQLWSYYSYTKDGKTWAPLRAFLRPNCWAWSVVTPADRGKDHLIITDAWEVLSYDIGVQDTSHTVTWWRGTPLAGFQHCGIIYDGGSLERDVDGYRYTRCIPSEPVPYVPTVTTRGCLLRTEANMLLGTWAPGQCWRWHDTGLLLHPSAMLSTPAGWLLAARELTPVHEPSTSRRNHGPVTKVRYEASITLWHVFGNQFSRVLTVPGGEDCGYCGLCPGDRAGEYYVSWYASDQVPAPGAEVFVGQLQVKN